MFRWNIILVLFAILFFGAASVSAQNWETIASDDARIHYVGRTWDASNTYGTGKMFSWSGTNATLSFEGTAVKALISRPSNTSGVDSSWYKVFIDGIFLLDIAYKDYNAATEILLAENLTEGTHTVTFYKRTETHMGSQLFLGFSVLGTSTTTLNIPSRRLEFIGNSITCGYGVLDSCVLNASTWAIEGTCPGFTTTSEDHYYSYAGVAARALGAEYQTLCWSGKGLYQNLGDSASSSNTTMPLLWNYAQPFVSKSDSSTAASWDYDRYIPQAVVINLGTNDFGNTTNPPEKEFVNTYVAFIQKIKAEYGDSTPVVLLHGPMVADSYPAGRNVATTLENYIDSTIAIIGPTAHKLVLSPNQSLKWGIGADWHPNKSQNILNGAELEAKLRDILGWVGTGDSSQAIAPRKQSVLGVKFFNTNQIELSLPQSGNLSVTLFSLDGRVISTIQAYKNAGNHTIAMPDSRIANGLYVLNVSTARNVWNQEVFIRDR